MTIVLTTNAVDDVSYNTATAHATLVSSDIFPLSGAGFVLGTTSHDNPGNVPEGASGYDFPVYSDTPTEPSDFSYALTTLAEGTRYYLRAWAYDGFEFTYGDEVSFVTSEHPAFRFTNLPGVVFDDEDTKTIFAERLNSILDRLDALE